MVISYGYLFYCILCCFICHQLLLCTCFHFLFLYLSFMLFMIWCCYRFLAVHFLCVLSSAISTSSLVVYSLGGIVSLVFLLLSDCSFEYCFWFWLSYMSYFGVLFLLYGCFYFCLWYFPLCYLCSFGITFRVVIGYGELLILLVFFHCLLFFCSCLHRFWVFVVLAYLISCSCSIHFWIVFWFLYAVQLLYFGCFLFVLFPLVWAVILFVFMVGWMIVVWLLFALYILYLFVCFVVIILVIWFVIFLDCFDFLIFSNF